MFCGDCDCLSIGKLRCLTQSIVDSIVVCGLKPLIRVEDRDNHLLVNVYFSEDHVESDVGMFLGSKFCNIKLICNFLRIQQILPHDRYITIAVYKPDGTCQTFEDKNVSSLRKMGLKKNLIVKGVL